MNSDNRTTNILLIVLMLGVVILVGIGMTLIFLSQKDGGDNAGGVPAPATAVPTEVAIIIPTGGPPSTPTPIPPLIPPEPEPEEPAGEVIAPDGVNVRGGPGQVYPILGAAPFGAKGKIIGKSGDERWWVAAIPEAPNGQGWVSANFVQVTNGEDVPVIAAPPTPIPPTSTPQASVIYTFSISPNPIKVGQCTTMQWSAGGSSVRIIKDNQTILLDNGPITGQLSDCHNSSGVKKYRLEVRNGVGQVTAQEQFLTVQDTAPANPLANTAWQVSAFNTNQIPLPETTLTAVFGGDGTINVNGGCNTYNGRYHVSGNAISVDDLAGTQMACSADINAQESAYINALNTASTYQLRGNQIILFNGAGQETVRFNRIG